MVWVGLTNFWNCLSCGRAFWEEESGERSGGSQRLNCNGGLWVLFLVFFFFNTIEAVFLVRKVIRCLWMFQKTKGAGEMQIPCFKCTPGDSLTH